jgi:hypothetical protein
LKKHIISSHKVQHNKIIQNFPDTNFFEVLNYLRKHNTFPFVNFKEDCINNTTDTTNEKESVGKLEGYKVSTDICKVNLYFLLILKEKYLILKNLFDNCLYSYMNDYNLLVNIFARNNFSAFKYLEGLKSNIC